MANHPVIDDLRNDHRAMKAMFGVIDEEMTAFSSGEHTDFERLLAAVEYCHAYPGAKHHPKEDIVFLYLKIRDADAAVKIGDLSAEHEILADYTRRFKSAIERILHGENIVRDQLKKLADDYTAFLNRHMQTEETIFFPVALATLTEDDWAVVANDIGNLRDVSLDPALEARLHKIRDIVVEAN